MALSPNYGWSEPDNSSLVKNGAADIRTLGDAIDTSLWNVGFGQAGKNKIINGDFNIWQRGTSFTGYSIYTADRWFITYDNAPTSSTVSRQAFTAGTAPVAGYESEYFLRMGITTAGTATSQFLYQKIEDVRTFAGNTVTYSFWAKADTTRTVGVYSYQNFGSGGSGDVSGTTTNFSVTSSWQRFSMTVALGSMTGKTIGANSFLGFVMTMPAVNGAALDFWGVQLEYGSKATPFETATGTIGGELALCQRYYYRQTAQETFSVFGFGSGQNTTAAKILINLPVTMRAVTSVDYSTLGAFDLTTLTAVTSVTIFERNQNTLNVTVGVGSGLTAFRPYFLLANNSTSAYLGFNAEL